MSPLETFQALPTAVKLWLMWLFLLQLGAFAFWSKPGARWVLLALLANMASMVALQHFFGRGPHMSLPHVLFWTPLLAYFVARRGDVWRQGRFYAVWCALLCSSVAVSLVIDYQSVLRWGLG